MKGLIGPWEQIAPVRATAPFDRWPVQLEAPEYLYAVLLDQLRVPPLLASRKAFVRLAKPAELDLLSAWTANYMEETLNEPRSEESALRARESMLREIRDGVAFVLDLGGAPVAHSTFNAITDDTVQIGGVWTPPELRSRGHARAVVAGQLQIARDEGRTRSVLFTQKTNMPAQRAYEAIGYRRIGEYGLIHFASQSHGVAR